MNPRPLRKIQLSRETVRVLSSAQLAAAVGAAAPGPSRVAQDFDPLLGPSGARPACP